MELQRPQQPRNTNSLMEQKKFERLKMTDMEQYHQKCTT